MFHRNEEAQIYLPARSPVVLAHLVNLLGELVCLSLFSPGTIGRNAASSKLVFGFEVIASKLDQEETLLVAVQVAIGFEEDTNLQFVTLEGGFVVNLELALGFIAGESRDVADGGVMEILVDEVQDNDLGLCSLEKSVSVCCKRVA